MPQTCKHVRTVGLGRLVSPPHYKCITRVDVAVQDVRALRQLFPEQLHQVREVVGLAPQACIGVQRTGRGGWRGT